MKAQSQDQAGLRDDARGQIARLLIRWPTAEELGFEPDDNVMMHRIRIVMASAEESVLPPPAMPMPGRRHP